MKTLKDHVIIYDDECPMCDLYTRAFVKTKMLDEKGREPYSWLPASLSKHIDRRKARNEIALVNSKNGKVLYGIDSLFEILGHRYAFLKPLFSLTLFRWLMKKFYSFISYNRRVIIPAEKFEAKNSCTPDFNHVYRWSYIVFAWLVVSLILNAYSEFLAPLIPPSNFYREFLISGGQILFQSIIISIICREKLVHYLGNMMTISLAGALLLLPAWIVAETGISLSGFYYGGWFILMAGLMFLEHSRRMKILNIRWIATATWIVYRLLVLLIIL